MQWKLDTYLSAKLIVFIRWKCFEGLKFCQ